MHLDDVLNISEDLKKVDVPHRRSESTADAYKNALSDFRSQKISFICSLDFAVQDLKVTTKRNSAKRSIADKFLRQYISCRLYHDDTVIVLQNLTQTTSIESPQLSLNDVQASVEGNVKSLIGAHRKPSPTRIF